MSVVKWLFLATIVGILVGLSTTFFLKLLNWSTGIGTQYKYYYFLMPSFIAGIVSYHVSSALGITYFHQPIKLTPVFSEWFFLKVVLSGVFFGLCSVFLIEMLRGFTKLSQRIRIWEPLKGIIGGSFLIVLTIIFSRQYLGLGLDAIQSSLDGTKTVWYAFILKTVFTSTTLSFGGSGGIVTPIFFIGSSAGILFASVFGLNVATFAAIGMVSVLAGAANTPIAASIMATELFGTGIAPYATIACIVSFLITGHRSVYPSQILSMRKSESINVDTGKEMQDIFAEAKPRGRSLTGVILKIIKIIRDSK